MVEPAPTQSEADILRQFLAGRDLKCTACGFNLRDLSTGTCPKCSAKLTLTVRPSHIRPFAWTAALIGYASLLMGCMPSMIVDVIFGFRGGSATTNHYQLAFWRIGTCSIAMLALLLLRPYRFYGIPLILRAVLAGAPPALVEGVIFFSL